MVFCLGRLYHFKYLKGYLPQILPVSFLNTSIHIQINNYVAVILEFAKDVLNRRIIG